MSTVPGRRATTQTDKAKTTPAKTRRKKGASYRYGYRDVPVKRPNGEFDIKRIPLTLKVKQYAKVDVPYYVIADAEEKDNRRRLSLIAYRLEGGQYKRVSLDDQGRVWLEPVGLWLGVRPDRATGSDRLALIDPANNETIGDYTAIARAGAQAMAQARESEARARESEARAEAEVRARGEAEARVRELEAELLKLRRGAS